MEPIYLSLFLFAHFRIALASNVLGQVLTAQFHAPLAAERDGPIFYPPTSTIDRRILLSSTSPYSMFTLVNTSTCVTPGLGRIIVSAKYKKDCYNAATELVKEIYDKDVVIGNPIYNSAETAGCYLINNYSTVIYNQHIEKVENRTDCSSDNLCVCKMCTPGRDFDEEKIEIDTCVDCVSFVFPHFVSRSPFLLLLVLNFNIYIHSFLPLIFLSRVACFSACFCVCVHCRCFIFFIACWLQK